MGELKENYWSVQVSRWAAAKFIVGSHVMVQAAVYAASWRHHSPVSSVYAEAVSPSSYPKACPFSWACRALRRALVITS